MLCFFTLFQNVESILQRKNEGNRKKGVHYCSIYKHKQNPNSAQSQLYQKLPYYHQGTNFK